MLTRIVLAVSLLVAPTAASSPKIRLHPPAEFDAGEYGGGTIQIIAHHCDKYGGIDSIAFDIKGNGPYKLAWNNEDICGRPS